ncbi:MAG: serine hydrolase domain-containing protein [Devosia sp.]
MSLKERADAVVDAALGNNIVGCVVLINQGGQRVYARAAGYADREAASPVAEDTIFRLASITKPIVATTALRMIDLGLLSLDDPVTKYLPFFSPKAPDGSTPVILIRHLLSHTSGLTYGSMPADVTGGSDTRPLIPLEENLRRLARAPLQFLPGTKWEYGTSIDVLGGVIGAIEGDVSNVDAAVIKYVSGPLGMTDTRFGLTDRSRLAHPYGDGTPEPIRMADPQRMVGADGNVSVMSPGRVFEPNATQCGGSAMAGTAGDFMKLIEAVSADFLSAGLRDAALGDQIGKVDMDRPGTKFTFLGALVTDAAASGWPKAGLIQWGGIWGNNWILDVATQTSLVVYTNTMWSGCNGLFRDQMRDAVFG